MAAAVLPSVDLIALRERRAGEPLLRALGVDPRRIVVTGDDAVEFAYRLRLPTLGRGIGVNLRLSDYSAVRSDVALKTAEVLRDLASIRDAPLVPVPISLARSEADIDTLRMMLPDSADELEVAASISSLPDLVRQVQRCRLVITGSYHAGVFALANGIPAVGMAGSTYYVDKFAGLADMFGEGCEVVRLDRRNYLDELRTAVDRLWDMADIVRPRLLASAEQQIACNHASYEKIASLVMHARTI